MESEVPQRVSGRQELQQAVNSERGFPVMDLLGKVALASCDPGDVLASG